MSISALESVKFLSIRTVGTVLNSTEFVYIPFLRLIVRMHVAVLLLVTPDVIGGNDCYYRYSRLLSEQIESVIRSIVLAYIGPN